MFDRGKLWAPGWHQLLDLFEFGEGAGSDGGGDSKAACAMDRGGAVRAGDGMEIVLLGGCERDGRRVC